MEEITIVNTKPFLSYTLKDFHLVHDKEEVYFDVPNANGHVYIIKLP
jgi:hypothetical protein